MDYRDYILQSDKTGLNFWFAAKLILIKNLLKKVFIEKVNNRTILDLGCGTGTELATLNEFGLVTALDNNQTSLNLIKQQGYEIILADIEKFSLPENSYDAVCCFDLLEHLTDDQKVLNDIFRSLKNNGYLLFTVPANKPIFSSHDLALAHRRRYNKKELNNKLTKADFTIITLGYWNSILFPLEAAIRLIKKFLFLKLLKITNHKSDAKPTNPIINKILFSILNFENILIDRGIKFPFGLTIYGIARKNVS